MAGGLWTVHEQFLSELLSWRLCKYTMDGSGPNLYLPCDSKCGVHTVLYILLIRDAYVTYNSLTYISSSPHT